MTAIHITPENFEGIPIDKNEHSISGKIGRANLNDAARIGDRLLVVAACEVVAVTHTDDPKRGLVRGHKLAVVAGTFTGSEAVKEEIARVLADNAVTEPSLFTFEGQSA